MCYNFSYKEEKMATKLTHMVSKLNNQDLDRKIKSLAMQEREILCEVLEHIKEAEDRRLYLDLKEQTRFDFTA